MKQISKLFALAIVCAVIGHVSTRTGLTQATPCLVATFNGAVQGVDRGASCAFLGVPYAAPPIGDLRWKSPQPAAGWAPAILNATAAPSRARNSTRRPASRLAVEDCLKLNVWTPHPPGSRPAPVIVWFHPGSFVAASANYPPQDGQNLAAQTGAIIVEPDYRLGPFGFLGHTALSGEGAGGGELRPPRPAVGARVGP